jgi:hypothetical protein
MAPTITAGRSFAASFECLLPRAGEHYSGQSAVMRSKGPKPSGPPATSVCPTAHNASKIVLQVAAGAAVNVETNMDSLNSDGSGALALEPLCPASLFARPGGVALQSRLQVAVCKCTLGASGSCHRLNFQLPLCFKQLEAHDR